MTAAANDIPLMHKQHAANAYQQSSYQGMGSQEVMAEAIRVMISTLYLARDAYIEKSYDQMANHLTKVLRILYVLTESLDPQTLVDYPAALPAAHFLSSRYKNVSLRISNLLWNPAIEAEFNAILEILMPVYRAWSTPPSDAAAAGE